MLSRTLPHTGSLLWPDSTLWEDLKCWDRPSNQPPAPAGSESQPQPTNTSAGGRREGAHVMANSAAGQTARRGLALTPPLPHSSEDGLRARPAAWSREGKSERLPSGGSQSLAAQRLSGGLWQPRDPPAQARAGTLTAGRRASPAPGPARPAHAGGSSDAAGDAASARSSSRTRSSCTAARPCGCAGVAPGRKGG